MREKNGRNKKRTLAITSIALVAVLIIGGVLAYLSNTTNKKENVFSFADNIRGEMDEPNWQAKDDLIPGIEIRKDPQITNTSSQKVDEYAAIQVTFKTGNGGTGSRLLNDTELTKLLGLIEIDWNMTDWELINGKIGTTALGEPEVKGPLVFAYKQVLKRGQITNPLFNTVKIKNTITTADFSWMTGNSPDHDKSCYDFTKACTCTPPNPIVRHHANCGVNQIPAADCDCMTVTQHEETCESLDGTLKPDCGHTVANALGGFTLIVDGAVVQANEFTGVSDTELVKAFQSLFGITP